jgi:rare lipoprotein A
MHGRTAARINNQNNQKDEPMMNLHRALLLMAACFAWTAASAQQSEQPAAGPKLLDPSITPVLDRTGKARQGLASYYGDQFAGRTMADGTPMDPESNIAASRTLPLGTKAKVTNLENGKSAVVEIRDRGPYVEGRIVDVTPTIAERLGMTEQGIVQVEVTPIEVPQRDGSIKKAKAIRTGGR